MLFDIFKENISFLKNTCNFPSLWIDVGIFLHANFMVVFFFRRTVILNSLEAAVVLFPTFQSWRHYIVETVALKWSTEVWKLAT